MPLTEEDEVFVEKCFQRSLLVCHHPWLHHHIFLTKGAGVGQAHLFWWHANCRLAPHRRNLSRRVRVHNADRLGARGTRWKIQVHLRGTLFATPTQKRISQITQLFENQSTVEYYEKFAAHAFENTTQSVISHCVLLKPSGAPVPCAFCFSIRRDIFDLPNIIIGEYPNCYAPDLTRLHK